MTKGNRMNPQLELLLKIQANEIKISEYEHEKRKLPSRKLLSEIIADVNSMQEIYAKAESVVNKIEQTYVALKKNCDLNAKRLIEDEKKVLALSDDTPIEDVDKLIAEITSFCNVEARMSEELKTMKLQLEKASSIATEIGKKINQRKLEYDKVKPEYDSLVASIDAKITDIQPVISQLEAQVEPEILEKFKSARAKLNKSPMYEIKSTVCKCCGNTIDASIKQQASKELFAECPCGALLYVRK